MFTSLIPMVGPGFHRGPPFFLGGPLMCLIILALVIGAVILAKRGKLGPPPWLRHGGPGWGPDPSGAGPAGPHGPGHHGPGHHGPGPHPSHPEDRAFEILAERLATGEIDADEYRERVAVLRETAATQYGPHGRADGPNPHDPHPGDPR